MRWSFSRLKSWDGCKLAWNKNYILKDKDQKQNFFASYGLFCEDLIQQAAEGKIEYKDLIKFFADNFDDAVPEDTIYMDRGGIPPLDMKQFYFDAALNFFRNFNGFSTPIISFQEQVDLTLDNGDEFIGYIDMLTGTPDKYSIVDFKSKGQFKSVKEKKDYAKQLFLYSEYTIKKYGKPPESMWFHLFRSYGKKDRKGNRKDVVKIPWNQKDYDAALQWRDDTIKDIKETALSNSNWEPENKNPDFFFCQHLCSFSHNCDLHKEINKDKIRKYESLVASVDNIDYF